MVRTLIRMMNSVSDLNTLMNNKHFKYNFFPYQVTILNFTTSMTTRSLVQHCNEEFASGKFPVYELLYL